MKPRGVILNRHSWHYFYFLTLNQVVELWRTKTEKHPLVIVYGFAYAVENGFDIVYNLARRFERDDFAFLVFPDFLPGRKPVLPAYVTVGIFPDAVYIIVRKRRNYADTGLVFIVLELLNLFLYIELVAEKRMRQQIRNRHDVFQRHVVQIMIYFPQMICRYSHQVRRIQHRLYRALRNFSLEWTPAPVEFGNRRIAQISIFPLKRVSFRFVGVKKRAVEHQIVYFVNQPTLPSIH